MDKVQHFEIPADNLERAKKFYRGVFGWRLVDFPNPSMEYVMAYTTEVDDKHMPKAVGVINGGLLKRGGPAQAPMIAVTVSDINTRLEKIKESGGSIVMEKKQISDMGLYAYVKDTEGNVIGVWQDLKNPQK